MQKEEKTIIHSLTIPFILVLIMWAVMIIRTIGGYNLSFLGVYPQKWFGLPGIVTTPFIHGDFSHLMANSVPMLLLGTALFLFYRDIAVRILVMIWLFTGFWVWVGGREAWHIGASGVVYGLSAFILTSGIIRRHTGLMAMALVVVFLYGSLIWGIFPEFFPEENISWESHLFGMVAGVALALYYRREGPQRRKYSWDLEEEAGDDMEGENIGDDENAYWNVTITDEEIRNITRTYRRHGNP
ncbi:MAG: rhomboid family intramembrane serine protease [Bacteroidales bacterium]|jgi:membrane associated rhomboid family serine protease